MTVALIVLFCLCAGLSISLFLIRREIRSVKNQLKDYEEGVEKPVEIVFVDRQLTELAAEINRSRALQREARLSLLRRERYLKEAVSNISHDLRTPLTAVIGYLQLLRKTELTEEQAGFLDIAVSKSQYLQSLIRDFYDISVWESTDRPPALEKIRLDSVLTDLVLSFAEQLEEKEITPSLTFQRTPVFVMADEVMLERMVMNLLSNAIRYGTRELHMEVMEEDFVQLTFRNQVEAGAEPDLSRLFEKFYTDDDSRSSAGSGLGLYIVKLLAEKMGGSVSADFQEDWLTIHLNLRSGQDRMERYTGGTADGTDIPNRR